MSIFWMILLAIYGARAGIWRNGYNQFVNFQHNVSKAWANIIFCSCSVTTKSPSWSRPASST